MKSKKAKILSLALTIVLLFTFVGTALACFDPPPPPTYSLTIYKNFEGIDEGVIPDFSFMVTNENGYSTTVGRSSFFKIEYGINAGWYKCEITGLEAGEYTIEEQNASVDGYDLTVYRKLAPVTGPIVIEIGKFKDCDVHITNSYEAQQEQTGSLTITKTFDFDDDDSISPPTGLYFQIMQGMSVVKTVWYSEFSESSYTIYDLPVGDYQIIEWGADIDGYDLNVSGIEGLVEVEANSNTQVNIVNTYTKKETPEGTLYVCKYAMVTDDSDLNFNGREFFFEVQDEEGNVVKTFSITVDVCGDGSESITLPFGTYKLVETGREITGYDVVTTFEEFSPCAALTTDNGDNDDTVKDTNSYNFTIEDEWNKEIQVTNSYTKQQPHTSYDGSLNIMKEVTNYDSGDTEFTFRCVIYDGEGEEYYREEFALMDGEKWTIGELTPGFTYYIEEISIPQNYYAVNEPISGTIEAGDNDVTYYNAYQSQDNPYTPVYYNLVIKWRDEDTGNALASDETISYLAGATYDVTAKQKTFDGYSFSRTDGADLTGIMNGNKTVTFYYKAAGGIEEIEEVDVPLAEQPEEVQIPEEPQVIPEEDTAIDIATDEIPLADVPQTGDDNNLTLFALLLGTGLAGIAVLTIIPRKSRKRK